MSNINWAQPVYGNDIQTSQAYLERLQEFLATQSGTGSSKVNTAITGFGSSSTTNNGESTGSPENHKRKSPSDSTDANKSAALKDRRQSTGDSSNVASHSHTVERSESPTDLSAGKGKKGSTSDKRKEQNRNAQRAFRERKERVLKDLEDKIDGLNKVNTDQLTENQNLRELVERLQEENARLQKASSNQPPAPQSSFTFSMPNTSTSSPSSAQPTSSTSAKADVDMPASFSDVDISAFLSRPVPQSQQVPSSQMPTLIQPSMGGDQNMSDDWFWNSSAFGTEIPQAMPPAVLNLTEPSSNKYINALFPWAFDSTNANTNSGANGGDSSNNATYPDSNNAFASFLNFSSNQQPVQQQQQQTQPSRGAHSNSGSTGTASSVNSASRRTGSNGNTADSPETTCSSSGSDPSEALPGTPSSSLPFLFGKEGAKNLSFASFGNGQSNFGGMAGAGQGQNNNASSAGFTTGSMFGGVNATTPSAIFDSMDYRDPLFAGLEESMTDPLGSFAPYIKGENRGENVDFNDFLVASPPSFNNGSGTSTGNSPASNSYNQQGGHSGNSSSASIPTLGSISNPPSSSSVHSYSSNSTSPQDPASTYPLSGTADVLPYPLTYGHPLMQHLGKEYANDFSNLVSKAPPQAGNTSAGQNPAAGASKTGSCGSVPVGGDEMDNLCQDMYLKAQCKEFARQRIQSSINQDETTMKLYEQYLRENQSKQT